MFRLREYIYLSIHSILVGTWIRLFISYTILSSSHLIYLQFFPIYLFHLQKESSLPLPQYSFYTCRYLHILIYILLFHSILFSSFPLYPLPSLLFSPLLILSPLLNSFYTCRYLHILIYIISSSSPSVLFFPSSSLPRQDIHL
jgi:hypothetical protein